MSVRWIVFDAVGTLIEPCPDVATVYHSIGQKYGSHLSPVEVSDRFQAAFQADDQSTSRLATDESIEVDRWRRIVCAALGDVDDTDNCFQDLFDHFGRPGSWRCFDDVCDILSELASQGYGLAVASNFDRRLHAICDGLGLLTRLEVRIISSEVGWRKPAIEFYRAVIKRLSASAESILVVGDDKLNDVIGPRSAGMQAIHLDRKTATHHRVAALGDSPIFSLTELRERLS